MTFFDWIGFTASGVQSFFAWATFNRDGFVDNVMMRQNQKYQQKNYQISWIAIARDDIRDMMGISVNRINNYMIVATLILGVAAGAIMGVSFQDRTPDYLCYSFYLCTSTSIIYLMLAIMFGVKGQNCAFTNTMKLLTCKIRPENPADYNHDYMKQAQWIEQTGIFRLFRIPGLNPHYETVHEKLVAEGKHPHRSKIFQSLQADGELRKREAAAGSAQASGHASPSHVNLEADTPLESLATKSTHLWYLTKFSRFMKLWQPYDTYSKYSMGLGIICLGQGSAYFALGQLLSEGRHLTYWAACAMTFAFIYMVVLVTTQNFKAKNPFVRFAVYAMLALGPLLSAFAAVTENIWVDRLFVPAAFFSHFIFWACALLLAQRSEDMTEERLDWLSMKSDRSKRKYAANTYPSVAAVGGGNYGNYGSYGGGRDWDAERANGQYSYEAKVQQQARAYGGLGDGNGTDDTRRGSDYVPDDGDVAAEADHWPTDDQEFADHADHTSDHIKRSVKQTLAASAGMWCAMFIWAVTRFAIEVPAEFRENHGTKNYDTAGMQELHVQWPSAFFRPNKIACFGDSVFLADRFSVFNFSENKMERVHCSLSRTIADIAAFCEGDVCRPLVLLAGGDARKAEVVDCVTGQVMPLLIESTSAHLLAIRVTSPQRGLRAQRLIAVQKDEELVQYAWEERRGGWTPEWYIGKARTSSSSSSGSASLCAIAAATVAGGMSGRLLLFRDTIGRQNSLTSLPAVEARSLDSMDLFGAWSLPPTALSTLASGCALNGGFSAFALPSFGSSPDGPDRSIVRLTLA